MKSIAAAFAALIIFASTGSAQWAKSGRKPDLSARAPKAPDGKIDLSGVWLPDVDPKGKPQGVESVENLAFPQYFVNIAADLKPDDVPIQPSAQALLMQRL